jgi:hypothetical protein
MGGEFFWRIEKVADFCYEQAQRIIVASCTDLAMLFMLYIFLFLISWISYFFSNLITSFFAIIVSSFLKK